MLKFASRQKCHTIVTCAKTGVKIMLVHVTGTRQGADSRRSKRRCRRGRPHGSEDQNGTIVRPALQMIVNLRRVLCITSQTKKCLMTCMRSYGTTVNTLLGLRAMVIL
jgi:hypothetical protein